MTLSHITSKPTPSSLCYPVWMGCCIADCSSELQTRKIRHTVITHVHKAGEACRGMVAGEVIYQLHGFGKVLNIQLQKQQPRKVQSLLAHWLNSAHEPHMVLTGASAELSQEEPREPVTIIVSSLDTWPRWPRGGHEAADAGISKKKLIHSSFILPFVVQMLFLPWTMLAVLQCIDCLGQTSISGGHKTSG